MKILVAVKRVVDYNVKVRVKPDGSDVDLANVKMSMNPFDEIAVESALQLKDAGLATEVVIVSVGVAKCEETIRSALAMGADRGILVSTEANVIEPLAVAKVLQAVFIKESPDLVLLGKQAIDDDCNQTGQMLAALIDRPQATFASSVEHLGDQSVNVTREVDGGHQTINVKLPAIITSDLRLNEPRFASLPNIMKAKKKPLDVLSPEALGLSESVFEPRLHRVETQEPAKRAGGVRVNSVQELIDKLKNEVGVL